MDMEQFDYLTYKKNKKQASKSEKAVRNEKKIISFLCMTTFVIFFIAAMVLIASKTSRVDIEYTKADSNINNTDTFDNDGDDTIAHERYTIDKRLFLIQQEEKGPSESRVIERNYNQTEVISRDSFDEMKVNSEEVIQNAEKKTAKKQEIISDQPAKTTPVIAKDEKVTIKPKLPTAPVKQEPVIKLSSALDLQTAPSKVLIGKYSSIDEAREMQTQLGSQGISVFVKRVNGHYTLQAGSFATYEMARNVAGRLRNKGLDVWIYQ